MSTIIIGKSFYFCCLCNSTPRREPDLSMHCFPREGIRRRVNYWNNEEGIFEYIPTREAWIRQLKLDEKMITRNTKVCSKHFTPEDYFSHGKLNKRKTLKKIAVPSLNLEKRERNRGLEKENRACSMEFVSVGDTQMAVKMESYECPMDVASVQDIEMVGEESCENPAEIIRDKEIEIVESLVDSNVEILEREISKCPLEIVNKQSHKFSGKMLENGNNMENYVRWKSTGERKQLTKTYASAKNMKKKIVFITKVNKTIRQDSIQGASENAQQHGSSKNLGTINEQLNPTTTKTSQPESTETSKAQKNTHFEHTYAQLNGPCKSMMTNTIKKTQIDSCSLYAELLAVKLREFDELGRATLMNEIDNLIYSAKMKSLQTTNPSLKHNERLQADIPTATQEQTTPAYESVFLPTTEQFSEEYENEECDEQVTNNADPMEENGYTIYNSTVKLEPM